MKNLFFKELKLSIHPLCYVFCLLFGLMGLIPNYPAFIGAIYCIVAYTFLFLGANKGQTTNDLFYSCNLPIRKQDVVKARIVSCTFLKAMVFTVLLIALAIRTYVIFPKITAAGGTLQNLGLDFKQGFALFGILILGLSLTDLIYLSWFYKSGKSIVGPTLVGVLFFCIFACFTTMIIPMGFPTIIETFTSLVPQILLFVGCLVASIGIEFLTYEISKKNLINLDF